MAPAAKERISKTGHSFRNVKFYNKSAYDEFVKMTHDKGSTVQREVNCMVEDCIRKNKLPSESAVILNQNEEVCEL